MYQCVRAYKRSIDFTTRVYTHHVARVSRTFQTSRLMVCVYFFVFFFLLFSPIFKRSHITLFSTIFLLYDIYITRGTVYYLGKNYAYDSDSGCILKNRKSSAIVVRLVTFYLKTFETSSYARCCCCISVPLYKK